MSNAISAQGTYFGTGDGASPEDFGELAEVVSIGGPNQTSEEIDVTHLRSMSGYREFIQSFKDSGELPLECNYVPGSLSQAAILAEFDTGTIKTRRIFYPDGATDTFSAYVKGITRGAVVGNKIPMNITFRLVGPVSMVGSGTSPAPA